MVSWPALRAQPRLMNQKLPCNTALFPALITQVHRQSELEFISILHAMRDGSATRQQLDRLWQLCRWLDS